MHVCAQPLLEMFARACLPHILCSLTLFWGSFWLRDPFALAICSGHFAGSRWGTKGLREAVRTETLLATATRVNTEDINNHRRQTMNGHLSDRNHGTVQPGFSQSCKRTQKMCLLAAQNIEHLLCEYRGLVLPGSHPQRGQPSEEYIESWRQVQPILATRVEHLAAKRS